MCIMVNQNISLLGCFIGHFWRDLQLWFNRSRSKQILVRVDLKFLATSLVHGKVDSQNFSFGLAIHTPTCSIYHKNQLSVLAVEIGGGLVLKSLSVFPLEKIQTHLQSRFIGWIFVA